MFSLKFYTVLRSSQEAVESIRALGGRAIRGRSEDGRIDPLDAPLLGDTSYTQLNRTKGRDDFLAQRKLVYFY